MNLEKADRASSAQGTIERAENAKHALNNPAILEAISSMERACIERLGAADVNDEKRLRTLTLALQSVRGFRALLEAFVQSEAIGRKELEKIEASNDEPTGFLSRVRRRI